MALPRRTTGSLWPTFVSARLVSLAVRRAYAIALVERFPTALSPPCHVPDPDNGPRLDVRDNKGGISRLAPPELAPRFHSLPPILHMLSLTPRRSCSKGS